MRRLAFAAALALAIVPACRRPDGPAERYRAFVAAARAGNADAVWAMLAASSRAELDRRAANVAQQAPGVVAPSGKALVLGSLAATAARPKAVVVARESAGAALVSVELEQGPAREVSLVREGGAWRVVVPFDN